MKPVDYLMSHRQAILEVWKEAGNLRETHELLCERIPGFVESMPYNTWKVKADVLIAALSVGEEKPSVQQCTTRKIGGWNVTRDKAGRYRLNRRVGKKVFSIYLGKEVNEKEALIKISFRERSLGLQ